MRRSELFLEPCVEARLQFRVLRFPDEIVELPRVFLVVEKQLRPLEIAHECVSHGAEAAVFLAAVAS